MARYVFDIETNGIKDFKFLTDLEVIHCIILKDIDTGEVLRFNTQRAQGSPGREGNIIAGVRKLMDADLLVGQNIIGFDIPAIKKLYPWFVTTGAVRDTKVCTQLIWPKDILVPKDYALIAKKKLPKNLIGKYSLEAWGHRIGEYKGAKQDFSQWSQELEDYCVQDVEVTAHLWTVICSKNYSEMAMVIEHAVAEIMREQTLDGVPFDEREAASLYADLAQRRLDLERELQQTFKPWTRLVKDGKPVIPKRDNVKKGVVAGCPYQKIKIETVTFNPGSRDHIASRMKVLFGWTPTEFTPGGDPKVDEKTLAPLNYPEAKLCVKYLTVQKRIGQLAEGDEALIKHVRNGRIHGEVDALGTVTRRGAHKRPNLGQVPKVKKHKERGILKGEEGGWGFEFRSLFIAPPGWVMVGADASGLELRMLGHYMARWDGGAYAKEVIEGDVHSITMDALGIASRDTSKTWKYAWLYGAGDEKLGAILKKGKAAGAKSRSLFLKKIPALGSLVDAVKLKHRTLRYLVGLDKGILHTRSEHAALNTLLQAAGAIVCKLWLVIMHRNLRRRGFLPGRDFTQVLWVHDEVQILARPEVADEIGKIAVESVRETGEVFGLKVPLDGEYKIGRTWAETH